VWKTIEGFPGYNISNHGRVKGKRVGFLQHSIEKGYHRVGLSHERKIHTLAVYRLVAIHFLPPSHTTETVNHKDGDKDNNHVSNLEWNNREENNKHAYAMGLKNNTGENNPRSNFTQVQVDVIKEALSQGFRQTDIACYFNVNNTVINHINTGRTWT